MRYSVSTCSIVFGLLGCMLLHNHHCVYCFFLSHSPTPLHPPLWLAQDVSVCEQPVWSSIGSCYPSKWRGMDGFKTENSGWPFGYLINNSKKALSSCPGGKPGGVVQAKPQSLPQTFQSLFCSWTFYRSWPSEKSEISLFSCPKGNSSRTSCL